MRTSPEEFYIIRDFGLYDSGLLGCMPAILFNVYEIIRRHVWRSETAGNPNWRRLFKDNKLASTVSQTEIGEALGRDRNTANEHIASLKKLGWLRIIPGADHSAPATYVLGERTADSNGRAHEVFYADAWTMDLWAQLKQEAEAQGDVGAKISVLTWEERREVCFQFIEKTSGLNFKKKTLEKRSKAIKEALEFQEYSDSEEVHREPYRGCTENGDGVAPESEQGVHRKTGMTPGEGAPKTQHRSSKPPTVDLSREVEIHKYRSDSPERESPRFAIPAGAAGDGSAPFLPDSAENVISGDRSSFVGTREKTRVLAYTKTHDNPPDDLPADARLARAAQVASGSALPALGRTNSTFKEKAEEARAKQAKALQAKESKLRNFDASKPHEVRQVLKRLESIWSSESKQKFGAAAGAWQIPDRKMAESLLKSYTFDLMEKSMKYLIGNWDGLSKRMFKGNGGPVPTIGVLSRCHATIFPEAADYAELAMVLNEWNAWFSAHPDDDPPADLSRRFEEARPKLKTMGLI